MAATSVHGSFTIDAHEFRDLTKALRQASRGLGGELRRDLREAGEVVAEAARVLISPHSKRIEESIHVRSRGNVVYVESGGGDLDIAVLFEVGNKGQTHGLTFRHPVFGVWRTGTPPEKMHPYLVPAAEASKDEALELVGNAIDRALRNVHIER